MKEREKKQPVAVFDSGVGGISVLRELVKLMPNEKFIYLGDSANAPYGTKAVETVRGLTIRHAQNFFEEGAKGLVVACNTATSAAVRKLRELYPDIPIVGIEPALKPAVIACEKPNVLVMATPVTIREEKFQKLMGRYKDQAVIHPLACPGLMDFVERGELEGEDLENYLEKLLSPYKNIKLTGVVLGCTHYPFVKKEIQKVLGNDAVIYDGGEGTAREMRRRLAETNLLVDADFQTAEVPSAKNVEFRNSLNNAEGKISLCKMLLESV